MKNFDTCKECHLKNKGEKKKENAAGAFGQEEFAFFSALKQEDEILGKAEVGAFETKRPSYKDILVKGNNAAKKIDNFTFDHQKGWVKERNDPHPKLKVKLQIDPKDWEEKGLVAPKVGLMTEETVADTELWVIF